MKSTGYFAGANGERGFVSYFNSALEGTKSIYILKGGCGCGKSALMKRIAAEAESRGEQVERIYCASDPDSLDGVVLPQRALALADGTAPHEISPRLPGAADTLINLGEFWDSTRLRRRRGEIKALVEKKDAAMRRAYSLLAATGCLYREKAALTEKAMLWEKMEKAAQRTVKKTSAEGTGFSADLRLRSAFCSKGTVYAPDYGEERTIPIKDKYGIAFMFLEQILTAAYGRGLALTLSPDPLCPDRIGAVLIKDVGLLFTAADSATEKPINTERFLDKERLAAIKGKLRFLNKAIKGLKEEARLAMAESRSAHADLEAIYTPAMDFGGVDRLSDKLIEEIFA